MIKAVLEMLWKHHRRSSGSKMTDFDRGYRACLDDMMTFYEIDKSGVLDAKEV